MIGEKDPGSHRSQDHSGELLSIDVDSHLEKLSSFSFRSRHHYPVEWVRSALKRGASRISVTINKQRVEIHDNGSGIPRDQLETLTAVADVRAAAEIREQAILTMQRERRAGMLTIFTPAATRILIQNHWQRENHAVKFQNRLLREFSTSTTDASAQRPTGTHLVIMRKTTDAAREAHILQAYCRGVKKHVTLNGQPVGGFSHFRHPILTAPLGPASGGLQGEVSIPAVGDVCRIWQLDSGIPLSRKVISPWQGYVFEAALEFDGDITSALLQKMERTVRKMYSHLVTHYPSYPENLQRRIETLVFKQHRLGGDGGLVDSLPAFAAKFSSSRFTLKELFQRAANKPIFASLSRERENNHTRPTVSHGLHLMLTPLQLDFLLNHSTLPLHVIHTPAAKPSRLAHLIRRFGRTIGLSYLRLLVRIQKPIELKMLSGDEKEFIKILSFYFTHHSGQPEFAPGKIAFLPGRGFSPAHALVPTHDPTGPFRLLIRRSHPVIKKAVKMTTRRSENIKIIGGYFVSIAHKVLF